MMFKYIGTDSWDRPVYKGKDGTLLVDTNPISTWPMSLHTKNGNNFDGEPDTPVEHIAKYRNVEITVDRRVTWY